MKFPLCLTVAWAAVMLAGCGRSNEDAIRHLVMAELIQREEVPEARVQIVEVRFEDDRRATVRARILDPSRGGEPRKTLICTVEKKGERWVVESVTEAATESGRKAIYGKQISASSRGDVMEQELRPKRFESFSRPSRKAKRATRGLLESPVSY